MKRFFALLPAALGLMLPALAYADYSLINNAVESAGSPLPFFVTSGVCQSGTGCGFVEMAAGIVDRFRPLVTVIAILVIVIYGYRMIVGQEEDVITKARGVMSGTIAGLIMAYLITPFIYAFYGNTGEVPRGAMVQGAEVVNVEISGVVNWVLTIVAALAVLMIILTTIKAIASSTGEEGIGNMRKTIFSIAFGILLLVFRVILSQGFVTNTKNPVPILASTLRIVSYVMGFLGLAAVVVVIYAGFIYIFSMGSEEQPGKAKGLLIRAALGAIVILTSLALVNFVMLPGVA